MNIEYIYKGIQNISVLHKSGIKNLFPHLSKLQVNMGQICRNEGVYW